MKCLQVGFLLVESTSAVLTPAVTAVLLPGQSNGRVSRATFSDSQDSKSYNNEDSYFLPQIGL